MNEDTAIIVCSRPESKRLPNKVFKPIAGIPVIQHIQTRLADTGLKIVWAIPPKLTPKYTPWIHIDDIYEGNAESPLHRMADYLKENQEIQWVIRVTHDDILIDKETLLNLLAECKRYEADYGFSPGIIEGAGVEVIARENLLDAAEHRSEPTEFVSYFVRHGKQIEYRPRKEICRKYRLTLDYQEDYVLLETVLRKLGPWAKLEEIAEFIDSNAHLLQINKLPDISVYTCIYNGEKWIKDAMRSVLSQDYEGKMEYIIVDDYSTDNTLTEIAKVRDGRISLALNEGNIGLSSSSNKAVSMAKGKYLMRVDADDILMPGAISNLIYQAKETKSAIVYPAYREVNHEGVSQRLLVSPKENHHAGCALMERDAVNQVRFQDGLRNWDSLDLYQRLRKQGFEIQYIDQPTWFYRKHNGNMSRSSERRDKDRGRITP